MPEKKTVTVLELVKKQFKKLNLDFALQGDDVAPEIIRSLQRQFADALTTALDDGEVEGFGKKDNIIKEYFDNPKQFRKENPKEAPGE